MTQTQTAPHPQQTTTGRFNRMAVWSLVLAIVTLGGIGSIAGIVMGVKARGQIARSGERGAGVALAGIVVGVLTTLFAIAYWIYIAKHLGGGHSGGGGGGTGGGGGGY